MDQLLQDWRLTDPKLVATTGIADVYKVRMPDGADAALKVYHDGDMHDERQGHALLDAMAGVAVPKIYHCGQGAVLMEWMAGDTLGTMARAGDDLGAGHKLAQAAAAFHAQARRLTLDLPALEEVFADLFTVRFAPACPDVVRQQTEYAVVLGRDLLATQTDVGPLHGDLHHDNVIDSPRGLLALDAKGQFGDRALDLAQAFANPHQAPEIYANPDRIARMAVIWAEALGVPKTRLLGWAIVKCAISAVWLADGPLVKGLHTDLIAHLIRTKENERP